MAPGTFPLNTHTVSYRGSHFVQHYVKLCFCCVILAFISEVTATTALSPTTETPAAVTQQLQSSASLDGPASSSASAGFESMKSGPSECECYPCSNKGLVTVACDTVLLLLFIFLVVFVFSL